MSRTLRYAAACAVVVVGTVGVAALTLDGNGALGMAAAAAVALPVQVAAFALLAGAAVGTNRFLALWLGGTVVRFVIVALGGWALVSLARLPALPTLLGLAGFFFVMLLLEPAFLGLGATRTTRDREKG